MNTITTRVFGDYGQGTCNVCTSATNLYVIMKFHAGFDGIFFCSLCLCRSPFRVFREGSRRNKITCHGVYITHSSLPGMIIVFVEVGAHNDEMRKRVLVGMIVVVTLGIRYILGCR